MEGITVMGNLSQFKLLICLWLSLVFFVSSVRASPVRSNIKCPSHGEDYWDKTADQVDDYELNKILKNVTVEYISQRVQLFNVGVIRGYQPHYMHQINAASTQECGTDKTSNQARNTVTSSSALGEKSLCPWVNAGDDENPDRFPSALPKIRCTCKNCKGHSDVTIDGIKHLIGCEQINENRFVLYKKKHGNVECWKRGIAAVPVGCACARNHG